MNLNSDIFDDDRDNNNFGNIYLMGTIDNKKDLPRSPQTNKVVN